MRRAKIVCTLGPATSTPERIGQLIDAGMDVARLNFSHGDRDTHLRTFQTVRAEAERRDRAVAVLLDVQGPKIRVGRFAEGQVELVAGQEFVITTDTSVPGDARRVSTTYAGLPGDVKVGAQILLDDGLLALEVAEVREREVVTVVRTGGVLKNNKGINLPDAEVSAPALTEKDRADLGFAVRIGVDYIALSFVRSAADVRQARTLVTANGQSIPIIAKIEKPQAVERLEEIITEADGIMVARGDLGVELGPEKVPLIQKRIIDATNDHGKVVITATQMLESMIRNQRPTRAEASDVANAVLDGTDALMLSGETAVGDHPIEAVRTMDRIIREVEKSPLYRLNLENPSLDLPVSANAIAHAAVIASKQMGIRNVAVVTDSGGAARLMSEYRPEACILALTTNEVTYRRLALYWGVVPLYIPPSATVDELFDNIEELLLDRRLCRPGEYVVVTASVPVGAGDTTNTLRIHRVGGASRA
ncbi:MAG TPA: pyruvate kinase [Kofleriaceae bacterium]|nr:pyruvate kinase [Kofleriaceae bacterium]